MREINQWPVQAVVVQPDFDWDATGGFFKRVPRDTGRVRVIRRERHFGVLSSIGPSDEVHEYQDAAERHALTWRFLSLLGVE